MKLVVLFVAVCFVASCTASLSGNVMLFSQGSPAVYDGSIWSPDGHWLVAESTSLTNITLFSATGQLVNQLQLGCDLGNEVGDISWTKDGRLSCQVSNEPPRVLLAKLNTKGQIITETTIPVPLAPGTTTFYMQWNPRHNWLATITEATPGSLIFQLSLSDVEGHALMKPMRVDAQELAWSPDGTKLALVQENGAILLLQIEQTTSGGLGLTPLRQLAVGTSPIDSLAWSPSGRWIVCRHESYTGEDYLFLQAVDGSGKTVQITSSTTDGQLYDPSWSPDGKQLIAGRASDGALVSLDIQTILKEKNIEP